MYACEDHSTVKYKVKSTGQIFWEFISAVAHGDTVMLFGSIEHALQKYFN